MGRPLSLVGTFEVAPRQMQWQLLTMYHTACLRCRDPDAAPPNALDTVLFACTKVASHAGIPPESATLCETVALRYAAHHFSKLAAQPAFCTLSAALVGRLLHLDDLDTESEQHTLLAMTPWLTAAGRTGADAVNALGGLRWAWLPLEVVLRLRQRDGALHHLADEEGVREMVDGAVAHICASRKRPRDDELDPLTCPITCAAQPPRPLKQNLAANDHPQKPARPLVLLSPRPRRACAARPPTYTRASTRTLSPASLRAAVTTSLKIPLSRPTATRTSDPRSWPSSRRATIARR